MRLSSTFTLFSLASLAACGGDDGPTPVDAAAIKDIGFTKPTATLKANNETAPDSWVEVGPANLACLNTPSADVPTTMPIQLTTTVRDFQRDPPNNLIANATVTAFRDQSVSQPFATAMSDAVTGQITITIPQGVTRFGYRMTHPDALDTLLLNQTLVSPSTTPQTVAQIQSVSTATGATLPALIGVSRTPGTGVLAGAVRDCNGDELSNFIATVSSTPNTVTHLEGVDTYYFSSSVGLPVRHGQQAHASKDGLFMAIEMNATPMAYVQVWGYPTQADLDGDQLKLIAQLQTQVIADTVITGSYDPLRSN